MASGGSMATSHEPPFVPLPTEKGTPSSSSLPLPGCFGPLASDIKVTPRRGEPGSDVKVQKPHTAMTIKLTTELLARLRQPGPKPRVELLLKSAAEGGPVLIVDGVKFNTNAHEMAIGSEVHMVARTELGTDGGRNGGPGLRDSSLGNASKKSSLTSMSMLASLHRKLIVQQVLTSTKRAEIRARTEGSARQIEEAKKRNMLVIEDKEEMLAAAEAIPIRQSRQLGIIREPGGGEQQRADRKRPRTTMPTEGALGMADPEGLLLRDSLTAWFYDCYNHDNYRGHVSDLQKFLNGIDLQHVMMRYHVNPDGTLVPDRRRFCVKFKTKEGRDLAVKRSGEALGALGSWSPERVPVIRGKFEAPDDAPTDYLLVLPQGSSVAELLATVKARLPQDLTPAVMQPTSSERKPSKISSVSAASKITTAREETLESYRRDMLRAALGASLASASSLGPEWGAPGARIVGTAEDNVHRVAMVGANEASRVSIGGGRVQLKRWVGMERLKLPSGPTRGARAQLREAINRG